MIIGAGVAGLAAAEVLRRRAPKSAITLISDEAHLPYSRSVSAAIHSPVATVGVKDKITWCVGRTLHFVPKLGSKSGRSASYRFF